MGKYTSGQYERSPAGQSPTASASSLTERGSRLLFQSAMINHPDPQMLSFQDLSLSLRFTQVRLFKKDKRECSVGSLVADAEYRNTARLRSLPTHPYISSPPAARAFHISPHQPRASTLASERASSGPAASPMEGF